MGPHSAAELVAQVGPLWIPSPQSRRRTKGQVRMVDDFSAFGVNATLESFEQVDGGGVDELAALTRFWLQERDEGRHGVAEAKWRDGVLRDLKEASARVARTM